MGHRASVTCRLDRADGRKISIVVPAPGFGIHRHKSVQHRNRAVRRSQAQTAVIALALGGVERLEQVLDRVRRHAHAVIAHRDAHQVLPPGPCGARDLHAYHSALRHGFAGIDHHAFQDPRQLRRRDAHRGVFVVEGRNQPDIFGQGALQIGHQRLDELPHADRFQLDALLAHQRTQARAQRGRRARRLAQLRL